MLHAFDRQQLAGRVLLCLGAVLVSFLLGGLPAAAPAAGGVIIGLLVSTLMVKLARPSSNPGELVEMEPALIPVLAYGIANPKNQLRASLLELVSEGHFTLEDKDGELWISKGDEGVELGPCGEVVETRVRGMLMDGDVKLEGLLGHLASAQSKTIPDIKSASEESTRDWTTPLLVRARLILAILSLLSGLLLLILSIRFGGAALGLAAGLYWPRSGQLRRLTPHWQAARSAWVEHLGDARVSAPSVKEWAPLMGLSLALGEGHMLTQMVERIEARKGRDKPLERLLAAALLLKDS